MKFALVVLACVAAVAHGQFKFNRANAFSSFGSPRYNTYRQPQYKPVVTTPFEQPAGLPIASAPVPRYYGEARNAQTLRSDNQIYPDGSYNYYFETDNGIAAQAQGTPRNFGGVPPVVPVVSQGSFSWTSPEGKVASISYVADENGYQPQGDILPTPPPIPPQIARALEYIARTAGRAQ